MEQHPVPQHISAYEFRLVGDMTLRQFGFLAGPCLLALIIYSSPLPIYAKWPLIFLFVLLGVGLAFFPIEERALDRWIVAFIKAVYSPTQFIYKKQPKKLAVFEVEAAKKAVAKKPTPPPDQTQLTQFLKTLPSEKTPLEKQEENFLKNVVALFQVTPFPIKVIHPVSPPPQPLPPQPPSPFPEIKPQPKPLMKKLEPKPPKIQPKISPLLEKKPFKLKIEPEKRKPAVEAKISPELPFPQSPQNPNVLVGMVLDQQNKIIEGAIIEIINSQGLPVRALKTNKIGQFQTITPLKNDTYEIETEKEGYNFDIIKVKLTGKIIEPIEIRAKGPAHRV